MNKLKDAIGLEKKKSNKHIHFPSEDDSAVGSQSHHGSDAMSVNQASYESGDQEAI